MIAPRSPAIGPDGAHRSRRSSSARLTIALLALAISAVSACGTDADTVFGESSGEGTGGTNPTGGSATSTGAAGSGGSGGPVCGDLLCQTGESPATCVQDCPPVCGDDVCNGGETFASCAEDCGACGDGECLFGETVANCPQDCKPECGDGECNGGETVDSCAQDCPPMCGDGACNGGETVQTCAQDCACAHPVCETGDALTPGCDPCVDMVCAQDPFCCDQGWDGACIDGANSICGAGCCGDGTCSGENCESCPQDCGGPCVCGDMKCEGEDCATCAQDCGVCIPDPVCPHSVCFDGGPLDTSLCFGPCADEVCAAQPSCCMGSPPAWDGSCTVLAQMTCGADACVTAVCNMDPTCCTDNWTQACIDLAKVECNTQCDCVHSICETGADNQPLSGTCNPCVDAVCTADPYCCMTDWDGYCVEGVEKICGINCN